MRATYKCRECRTEEHTWRNCPKNFTHKIAKANRSKVVQKKIPKGVNVLDWIKSKSYKPDNAIKTNEVVPEIDFNSKLDEDEMPGLEDIIKENDVTKEEEDPATELLEPDSVVDADASDVDDNYSDEDGLKVDDTDYAEDIIPGGMINAETIQRMINELFEQDTQPNTALEDELAATNNEEHYNNVLAAYGLPPPSLHFHCENEQFEEKGNAVTPDPEDTSLPKNENLKLKSANFYQVDGNGIKTLTFKVRTPAERQTEWEKFNALGLSSKVMFYKDSCYLSDADTKIEFEKQGGKCLVPGCKVKLELEDFRGIGCKGHRDQTVTTAKSLLD